MIPSITPPTDNLYKFLSLFGLTIFLFSVYNLGLVYDRSSDCKIKIEDVKIEIQVTLFESTNKVIKSFHEDSTRFRPSQIKKLDEDLSEVKKIVLNSKYIEPINKIQLNGKISKLKVEIDALTLKFWSYVGMICIGIFIMMRGFTRWQKREQKLRDSILSMEHDLQQNKLEDELEDQEKKG